MTVITVTSNKGSSIGNTATIDTGPGSIDNLNLPSTCAPVIASLNSSVNSSVFLNNYALNNVIQTLSSFATQINTFQDATITNPELVDYLNQITNNYIPSLTLINNCVSEKSATEIVNNQAFETSQARLNAASDPRVSYYEGWFPIYRPLTTYALFTLFGLGIFFFLLTVFLFLQMQGIQIVLQMPASSGTLDQLISYIKLGGPYIIGGTVSGVIFVIIGKTRGWF